MYGRAQHPHAEIADIYLPSAEQRLASLPCRQVSLIRARPATRQHPRRRPQCAAIFKLARDGFEQPFPLRWVEQVGRAIVWSGTRCSALSGVVVFTQKPLEDPVGPKPSFQACTSENVTGV
jgi:hypothetical protein